MNNELERIQNGSSPGIPAFAWKNCGNHKKISQNNQLSDHLNLEPPT
jgi:hypothetical protein